MFALDGDTVTATLMVPNVRLNGLEAQDVETFLVITINRNSIAGPPLGQEQLYEIVPLSGKASSVRS